MAFPGNSRGGWNDSPKNPPVYSDADNREKQVAGLPLEKRQRRQITEIAKDQSARANVISAATQQPNESAGKNDPGRRNANELDSTANAKDAAEDEKRQCICNEMLERTMQERCPNDSR